MIPLNTTNLFGNDDPVVKPDGSLSRVFYFLIRALLLRTGDSGGVPFTVETGMEAAGAAQATATELVNDFNEVTAGPGAGVILANLQPGQTQTVFNGSGGGISVYPPVSGSIDALAANDAYALANGKTQIFTCYSINAAGASFLRSLQLG